MDIADVERRVAEIEREKDDLEAAHGSQDSLFHDVLIAIARNETSDATALAQAALKVDEIEFDRYTA